MSDLSILIPTRARPDKLETCLRCLDGQTLADDRFEVVIGIDGPDEHTPRLLERLRDELAIGKRLRWFRLPRLGLIGVRNALLGHLRGEILVSINDDVRPAPEFLETHLIEQRRRIERGRPAIVSGYSPFVSRDDETLLQRLVRETGMIFFYDEMLRGEDERDWGYRHCYGLNFSAPLDLVRRAGGFCFVPDAYGYEDLELAWRLQRYFGVPVLFARHALAPHDHAMCTRDLIEREHKLGIAAWRFSTVNPAFCADLFGRPIASNDELAYNEAFCAREDGDVRRLQDAFYALDDMKANDAGEDSRLLTILCQQWTPVKRYHWRRGLLEAASGSLRQVA